MTVNLDAIDLSQIDDPHLRAQLDATIAETRQLRQYCWRVQREARFKSHFLARISHELRSPLSGIIGSHQLVLEELCENHDEEIDFVRQANDAAMRLIEMLDALLLVSRLEAGRKVPKIEPIALSQLLKAVREPIGLEATNSSIHFQVRAREPESQVLADADILTAILIDFLELAIDVGRDRQLGMTLTCQTQADRVEFQLDSALRASDFSDAIDYLDRSDFGSADSKPAKFELTPSMRLTLNALLVELLGGGCGLPIAREVESGQSGSRLCFWMPRAV